MRNFQLPIASTNFAARIARGAALLLALLCGGLATPAEARNWRVQVGGSQLEFSPKVLTISPGDTVTFTNRGGYHNVVADNGSFRCAHGCDGDGNGGSGNSDTSIWFATVAFPNAGTVGYFCEAHGSPGVGMFGTVIVQQPPAPVAVPVAPGSGLRFAALLVAAVLAGAAWGLRRRLKARR